jgi:integrase
LAGSFSGKQLSQISPIMVEKHKRDRKEAGAPVRANRELAVLKKLINQCVEDGTFEGRNPVEAVELFKEPHGKERVLTLEEEARLLAECTGALRLAVLIGLHCGLRMRSEILTLRWEHLDLRKSTVTVVAAYAKNGKTRTVPLNSIVRAELDHYPRTEEWVFTHASGAPLQSIHAGFNAACQRAGLTQVTPHTLRHTFASRLIASGVDPIKVTKLAGWSSIKMLDRYAHADASGLAEAVERLVQKNSPTGAHTVEKQALVRIA